MAEEYLEEAGIFVDEITKKVELLDPERVKLTDSLLVHIEEFQKCGVDLEESLGGVVAAMDRMAKLVDGARQKVFGVETSLILEGMIREKEERLLSEKIRFKSVEIERQRSYKEAIVRQKNEMLEIINNMNK